MLSDKLRGVQAFGHDLDGVFRDTGYHAYETTCAVVRELGGDPPATFEEFVLRLPTRYDDFFRSCGIPGGEDQFMACYGEHMRQQDDTAPFDDVYDHLATLRDRGIKMFIVSGAGPNRVEQWLVRHNLRGFFDYVSAGSRDKARCISMACAWLEVEPPRTGFVGDWGLDMRGATDAGAIPIGITRGYESAAALRHCGAAHVIEHLSELVDALS